MHSFPHSSVYFLWAPPFFPVPCALCCGSISRQTFLRSRPRPLGVSLLRARARGPSPRFFSCPSRPRPAMFFSCPRLFYFLFVRPSFCSRWGRFSGLPGSTPAPPIVRTGLAFPLPLPSLCRAVLRPVQPARAARAARSFPPCGGVVVVLCCHPACSILFVSVPLSASHFFLAASSLVVHVRPPRFPSSSSSRFLSRSLVSAPSSHSQARVLQLPLRPSCLPPRFLPCLICHTHIYYTRFRYKGSVRIIITTQQNYTQQLYLHSLLPPATTTTYKTLALYTTPQYTASYYCSHLRLTTATTSASTII